MKFEADVTVAGDVCLIYSPTMRCETAVLHDKLDQTLRNLIGEWVEMHQAEGTFPSSELDIYPYTLLVGGSRVEEAHSHLCFDTKEDRLKYWRRYTGREYCWIPAPNGEWLANTDANVRTVS